MSSINKQRGTVGWIDLTVDNADGVRDFYSDVIGWEAEGCDMGGYEDYVMKPPRGEGVAGVCHARGTNADAPQGRWTVYFVVDDLDDSLERVKARGGEVIGGPKGAAGKDRYAFIRDPGGGMCALYQPGG